MGVRKNLSLSVLDRLKNDVFIEEQEFQKKEPHEKTINKNELAKKNSKSKTEEVSKKINVSSKNKKKYEELHTRKTYYIKNELITKMDELFEETGLNRSEIVNLALIELFKRINIVDDIN